MNHAETIELYPKNGKTKSNANDDGLTIAVEDLLKKTEQLLRDVPLNKNPNMPSVIERLLSSDARRYAYHQSSLDEEVLKTRLAVAESYRRDIQTFLGARSKELMARGAGHLMATFSELSYNVRKSVELGNARLGEIMAECAPLYRNWAGCTEEEKEQLVTGLKHRIFNDIDQQDQRVEVLANVLFRLITNLANELCDGRR